MENVQDNKTRITLKALELFMSYGIRSVSMDEIASALGISKKTIYQYYSDKDALVLEVVEVVLNKNCEECKADREIAKNAVEEGFLAISQTAELFKRMNPLLIFDLKKYYPKAYKTYVDFKTNFLYEILKASLKRGIKEGLFRPDINVEIAARFRVESILIPFTPEFFNNIKTGIEEAKLELFYIFMFGVASPKGYKLIEKYIKTKTKSIKND